MGKVYIVGAGPGDPDLLTVKGLRCIQQADVIVYDRLVNEELLSYAKSGAELIYCGKLPNYHIMPQETINATLVKYAKQGRTVTRLKGGDPFIFGRGAEEAAALVRHGLSYEVVPGVTAGIAAPAYAGIPVTHRDAGASFAIVTGHRRKDTAEDIKWESLAKGIDTLAIYMGVSNLPYICAQLLKHGKDADTPVALIEWGTTARQRTVIGTLSTIVTVAQREAVKNPSMIVVGAVVRYHEQLRWFQELPQNDYVSEAL